MSHRVLLVVAVLAAVLARADAAGAAWRWPVRGTVVGRFAVSAGAPYAAGQRRGIDVAAAPGAPVLAACAGRVSFAGRLPVRGGGLGVSVRCGVLTATHLHLGALAVRRGTRVAAGAALGRLGRDGVLRLGARVTARRFGYVDPLGLLADDPVTHGPPPLGPAPRPRGRVPVVPVPAPVPALPHATRAPAGIPAAVWLGLALVAAGLVGRGWVGRIPFASRWARSTSPRRSTTSTRHRTSAMRTRRSRPT